MEFNGEPPINSMWSLEGLARIRNKLELESDIQDYNAHIEQHGVFAADKRRF
jgi:hypothetical protein